MKRIEILAKFQQIFYHYQLITREFEEKSSCPTWRLSDMNGD